MRRERDEDLLHDEAVQRDVDDRWEICIACEPWFDKSAFIDVAFLVDQHLEGQIAGRQGATAGMNPNDPHTPGYDAWERGRRAIEGISVARAA
jgi:hypothetical protein